MLNADVTDGFASVNGLRLHYREWPNGGAPTLLLLHGLACHARMWDSFANSLSHGHRIIALDARGHGESDHATDYSSARHIEDLSGFIEQLRLRDLTIVGHSSGSWYARRYALQRPKALTRLIMVDEALPHPEQSSVWPTAAAPPMEVFDDRKVGIASFISWLTSLGAGPEPGSDTPATAHEWDNFFRWNITTTTDDRYTWRWDRRMLQPRPPSASHAQMSYAEAVAEDWRAFSQVEIPSSSSVAGSVAASRRRRSRSWRSASQMSRSPRSRQLATWSCATSRVASAMSRTSSSRDRPHDHPHHDATDVGNAGLEPATFSV